MPIRRPQKMSKLTKSMRKHIRWQKAGLVRTPSGRLKKGLSKEEIERRRKAAVERSIEMRKASEAARLKKSVEKARRKRRGLRPPRPPYNLLMLPGRGK